MSRAFSCQLWFDDLWTYTYHGRQNDYQTDFLISTRNSGPKQPEPCERPPNSGTMSIMISRSDIFLVFFGVEQRIEGYERREKRGERRRRSGLRCDVLSCAVLSCAVNN